LYSIGKTDSFFSMELRHLRYFVEVAERGTFGAASRSLHVAQSAISEQIADLEQELGAPLLKRTARKPLLTAAGSAFLAESRRILAEVDGAADLVRRIHRGQAGSLRIGFFAGGMGIDLPRLIRRFREQFPAVQLSLLEMTSTQQWQALAQGRIDIAFTRRLEPEYRPELRSVVLKHDPMMAILPKGHRAAPGPVDIRDLANESFVLSSREVSPAVFDKVIELCSEAGFSPRIASISSVWSSVVLMVQAGVGISLLPSNEQQFRATDLAFCPLTAKNAFVEFVMAWSSKEENPIVRSFRALVLAHQKAKEPARQLR
jgi:DNA-binding transcriptional LysR family regulator